MRRFIAVSIVCLAAASPAQAITVDFTSTLSGANERPNPNASAGAGTATGQLTGDPGVFVFTYHVEYAGLSGLAGLGHIHDAVNPGGQPFVDQFGPIIHDLDSLPSPVDGDWRYDDAAQPLTDEFASALLAGRMYFNLHTELFPAGEIRGQIVPVIDPPPPPPPNPIPLPAPVWMGLVGMAGSTFAAWRARRR